MESRLTWCPVCLVQITISEAIDTDIHPSCYLLQEKAMPTINHKTMSRGNRRRRIAALSERVAALAPTHLGYDQRTW